jgi:prephenate dehydrogenase
MGMMGASLAAALRKHSSPPHVTGVVRSQKSADWINEQSLARALVMPEFNPSLLDLSRFDLIVLGMPVRANAEMLREMSELNSVELPLITDMSSTRKLLDDVAVSLPGLPFIGSHPMCGSEDAGPGAYREDLFLNRLVILTPPDQGPASAGDDVDSRMKLLKDFWISTGAKVYALGAGEHDLVLAYLSHAPHLVSSLLAIITAERSEVSRINNESPIPITGGGLRDMLRIAGSNPEMWHDILLTNKSYILDSLHDFRAGLDRLIENVEADNLEWWSDWQKRARKSRDEISGYQGLP